MSENTVTPELLKVCRAIGKRSSLDAGAIVRWSRETGEYSLELFDRIDNGPNAVEPTREVRWSFPIAGIQQVYQRDAGRDHTSLYAYPMCTRAAIGIGNVCRAGDMLRASFMIGNTSERMLAAGWSEDRCTLEVFRGNKLVCELAFDVRITELGNAYGMRGYHS